MMCLKVPRIFQGSGPTRQYGDANVVITKNLHILPQEIWHDQFEFEETFHDGGADIISRGVFLNAWHITDENDISSDFGCVRQNKYKPGWDVVKAFCIANGAIEYGIYSKMQTEKILGEEEVHFP